MGDCAELRYLKHSCRPDRFELPRVQCKPATIPVNRPPFRWTRKKWPVWLRNHGRFASESVGDGTLIGDRLHLSNGGTELSGAHNSIDNFVTGRAFASEPPFGIVGQAVSSLGLPIGTELSLSSGAPNGQVAYNPNTNEYLVTWKDQLTPDPTGPVGLEGQRISGSGPLIGTPIVISNISPESSSPTASISIRPGC